MKKTRLGSGGYGAKRYISFAGKTTDAGVVADAFLASMATSTAIKKPGVPKGTPDWLKTTVEIMLGRRGNAISIPPARNLTFSSTPTKEECEALFNHLNEVRSALADLTNRFDS